MTSLEPWRHSNFRRLFIGRTVNYLGNAVAPIALAFAVLDLTGSVTSLGVVVAARSLANVALLLVGGVVADRLPRPLVLTGSQVVAAASQAVVAALVLTGTASVPLLAALGVVNGAAAALAFPATAALVPQSVPPHLLREANALSRLGINAALVGGAAAGGALVAFVGPGWGLVVDAACFAVSAACFVGITVPAVRTGEPTRPLRDLRDGWSEFVARRWVWVVVLQFCVVNAAWVAGTVVLAPAVADASFGRAGLGLSFAALTSGLLLGALVAMRWRPQRALRAGVLASTVLALPLVALAVAPTLLVLVPAMFLAGIALEQFGVAWDVALQEHVPPDRLARVYSYDALGSFVAIPVGEVSVGPVAEHVGLAPTLLGCAALVVVATLLALTSSEVRGLRRRSVKPDRRPAPA